jgi:hypothetical protein
VIDIVREALNACDFEGDAPGDDAPALVAELRARGQLVVPESFVTSVLYSGAFEGEDLQRLYAEAELLLERVETDTGTSASSEPS